VVKDALGINLLPLQSLLTKFDRFRNGIACRSAWAGRKIPLEVVSSVFLELLRVTSDLCSEAAAEHTCKLPHRAVQIEAGSADNNRLGWCTSTCRARFAVAALNIARAVCAHGNILNALGAFWPGISSLRHNIGRVLTPTVKNVDTGQVPDIFLFTDTNLFLQARSLQEVSWTDLFDGPEIVLIVPRAVQREISALKSDENSRRSKRARSAAALFMRIAQAADATIVIRAERPRVSIQLPGRVALCTATPDGLDLTRTDDEILAEILGFQAAHAAFDVRLLTDDSDQVVSARHFGIPFVVIPDDCGACQAVWDTWHWNLVTILLCL
jgi:hypothetical protein